MNTFILEIIELLNTQAGSMAYHLVISFSLLGALAIAVPHLLRNNTAGNRRVAIGIGVLLMLRILMFLIVGLLDQNIFDYQGIVPEINRSFDIINLFVLIGILVFSFAKSRNKSYSLFTWLIITFFGILLVFIWISYSPPISIETNLYIAYSNLLLIIFLYIGIVLITYRQPKNWLLGLAMFSILFLGEIGQTFIFSNQSDYPFFARLLQLSSFPLLFGITFDQKEHETQKIDRAKNGASLLTERYNLISRPTKSFSEEENNNSNSLDIFLTLLKIENNKDPERSLSLFLSHSFVSDIVLLISPPNKQKKSIILSGYDLISEKHFFLDPTDEIQIPDLKKGFKNNDPIRFSANRPELKHIAELLSLADLGNTIAIPVNKNKKTPQFCILIAYPYTNQEFKNTDIELILNSTDQIIKYMDKNSTKESSEWDIFARKLKESKNMASRFENESKLLLQEISSIKESSSKQLLKESENANSIINNLNFENKELADNLEKALLEENSLSEQIRIINENKKQSAKTFNSIANELKDRVSSLLKTEEDLLRKAKDTNLKTENNFLRNGVATLHQLNGLVNNLSYISAIEAEEIKFTPTPTDLSEIIDEALTIFSNDVREKRIALRVDLPSNLPVLHTDKDALLEIVLSLLKNAGSACRVNGEVFIKAKCEVKKSANNSIRLEITDSGDGVSEKDMDRIFSHSQLSITQPIMGLGNIGLGLSISKMLLELLGGEISVQSQIGEGTTFCITLPVNPTKEQSSGAF